MALKEVTLCFHLAEDNTSSAWFSSDTSSGVQPPGHKKRRTGLQPPAPGATAGSKGHEGQPWGGALSDGAAQPQGSCPIGVMTNRRAGPARLCPKARLLGKINEFCCKPQIWSWHVTQKAHTEPSLISEAGHQE